MAFAIDSPSSSKPRVLINSVKSAPAIGFSSLNFLPAPKGMIARYSDGFDLIISTRSGCRFAVRLLNWSVTFGKDFRVKGIPVVMGGRLGASP